MKSNISTLICFIGGLVGLQAQSSALPTDPIMPSVAMAQHVFTVPAGNQRDEDIPIYEQGGSITPYVDRDGYANPRTNLGMINFGDGLTLPLLLNFSSAVRSPSPEFGPGWECTLFDSCVFDVKKDVKEMHTLGGKRLFLIYDPRTDIWKHLYTDKWTAKADGDRLEVTYKSGCKLVYERGLISSLTTPGGRTINWNRSDDKVISLQEAGKPIALSVSYDKLGIAHEILFQPGQFGGAAASSLEFESDPVYACIKNVAFSNGQKYNFAQGHDSSLNPYISWTDPFSNISKICWDKKSGLITADNQYSYNITEINSDHTYPKITRTEVDTGRIESYYFDEKHGTTDQTFPDGTQRHIETVSAPGPNYKEARLIQDTKNGITTEVVRRAFDSAGHLILEANGLANGKESVRQYVYDDAGRITAFVFNGTEMWKNEYDAQGRLITRLVENLGIKEQFDYLPGGDVVEQVMSKLTGPNQKKQITSVDWPKRLALMERSY